MDIKRILVPIDFSDNALKGKAAAEAIADAFKAEVRLLHVVDSAPYEVYVKRGFQVPVYIPIGDVPPNATSHVVVRNLMHEARTHLEDLAGKATGRGVEVRHGHIVEQILLEIDSYRPDLVVLCTHGWTGIKHMLLGSVTERVVRLSPAPVLTVRGAA
jgi:nucleotide-binding universal stress UspA family protein